MRFICSILIAELMCCGLTLANVSAHGGGAAVEAKHAGTPPGLAKKGGLPPGLAKQFGAAVPEKAYVAVDPRYDDRAWFLVDGRWVLRQGFDPDLRLEVHSVMALPAIAVPPPVPLPSAAVSLHVVVFD